MHVTITPKIGDPSDPGSLVHGQGQAFTPINGKFGFAAFPKQDTLFSPTSSLGGVMIAYQTSPGEPALVMDIVFVSDPTTTHEVEQCGSPEIAACRPES